MKALLISICLSGSMAFAGEVVNHQEAIFPGVGKVTSIAYRTESVDSIDLQVFVTCFDIKNGKKTERPQRFLGRVDDEVPCGTTVTRFDPEKDPDHILVGYLMLSHRAGPSHCDPNDPASKMTIRVDVRKECAK